MIKKIVDEEADVTIFECDSIEEARAFILGIEFVNDSSLEVTLVDKTQVEGSVDGRSYVKTTEK